MLHKGLKPTESEFSILLGKPNLLRRNREQANYRDVIRIERAVSNFRGIGMAEWVSAAARVRTLEFPVHRREIENQGLHIKGVTRSRTGQN